MNTMKTVLFLAFLLPTQVAWAEWVEIGTTDQGTLYASRAIDWRRGERVRLMEMTEFRAPLPINGELAQSSTYQVEYDCGEARSRTLALYYHAGHMGGGEPVGRSTIHREWDAIPPDTLDWAKLKHACGA